MRLINTRTLAMHDFVGRPPGYAILSHTWGKGEVTFQDFYYPESRERLRGFAKIKAACQQAQRENIGYAWVDSCCIDKTSSSELGEAINSMFKWYRDAAVCYAFLEDITLEDVPLYKGDTGLSTTATIGFGHSKWFTRGWTLQELIAPQRVDFYNQKWQKIGEKRAMSEALARTTGIDAFILNGTGDLQQVSVGRRMSWAAGRETERPEDIAYSLLGLFDANIPLIYGEGTRAFLRLQEKILEQADDHTIFAWRGTTSDGYALNNRDRGCGLFAASPNDFQNFLSGPQLVEPRSSEKAVTVRSADNLARIWGSKMPSDPITKTHKGIRITSKVKDLRYPWAKRDLILLLLNCCFDGDPKAAAGIYLKRQGENHYVRIRASEVASVHPDSTHTISTVYGLGSVADIQHHHYADQWTTSTRILGEMAEAGTLGRDASLVRDEYRDAFHIPRSSFSIYGMLEAFYLDRIWTVDGLGLWRSFLLNPREHSGDLVLKTHSRFNTALVFASRSGKYNLFIFLGTHPVQAEGSAYTYGTCSHYLSAICLSAEQAAQLHSRFISNGFRNHETRATMRAQDFDMGVVLRVPCGQSLLRVAANSTILYGIPMHRLRISWAFLLSDVARFLARGPAIIIYLTGLLYVFILMSNPSSERDPDPSRQYEGSRTFPTA